MSLCIQICSAVQVCSFLAMFLLLIVLSFSFLDFKVYFNLHSPLEHTGVEGNFGSHFSPQTLYLLVLALPGAISTMASVI